MEEKCLDALGQEIVVGSVIAHGQRSYQTGNLAFYVVKEVEFIKKHSVSEYWDEWKIKARGGESNWYGKWSVRNATLLTPKRMVVLSGEQAELVKKFIGD